ncbi:hypothetical protein PR202_ga15508 [Eleusine coracana subsp. coracana]|uniref:Uncharacterized protein n=1 Tax=Eleusine coracana subsp. coracana TaxID=191504 RepID=A0AAV5CK10_ELECO|nr:hypothetical protein PR202_ga15508 [Eleusine coracana subsp. coracana]
MWKELAGYNQKKGDGARCDRSFKLGPCCTLKFQIGRLKKRKKLNVAPASGATSSSYSAFLERRLMESIRSRSYCTGALRVKYSEAESNVMELERLGAIVLHGVDACAKTMNCHEGVKICLGEGEKKFQERGVGERSRRRSPHGRIQSPPRSGEWRSPPPPCWGEWRIPLPPREGRSPSTLPSLEGKGEESRYRRARGGSLRSRAQGSPPPTPQPEGSSPTNAAARGEAASDAALEGREPTAVARGKAASDAALEM